ncbi:Ig-like domain repeat protein [Aquirufa sp. TARAVU-A1A]
MKQVTNKLFKLLAVLTVVSLVFSSCQKDEEVFPVPTVTSAGTLSGVTGATVTVKATISAPAGLKSITVLKNGIAFDSKTYSAGEKTAEYSKDYVVEGAAGTVVTFSIQATDLKGQVSTISGVSVNVTAVPPKAIVEVKGNLEGNVTWTADKIYKLVGFVRVGQEDAFGVITKKGVLTIQPGTVIIGERASKGALIVQRGSQIIANGTASAPIVFTSERAPGEREAGDWGGLVICGQAPNNLPNDATNRQLEGGYGAFHGGTDPADNSGSLKYVRLEYAGIPINPNQEVNSLTLGSVGSATTIDYVQASFGLDDSFEWFGGTVNAKHLIAYKGLDDDFDTDNGFSGYVQFGVGIRGAAIADQSGSNGFECDNDANGSANTPFTSAIFANMSIIGAKGATNIAIDPLFQNGAQLRRNNKQKIYNTVITGYPYGVYIDSQKGSAKVNAANGDIDLQNVVLAGVEGWGPGGFGLGWSVNVKPMGVAVPGFENMASGTNGAAILIGDKSPEDWFKSLTGNKILGSNANMGLSSTLWSAGRPTFVLTTGTSESLIGPKLKSDLPAFFEATDYVGAFKSTDWTAGWSEFAPQSIVYVK